MKPGRVLGLLLLCSCSSSDLLSAVRASVAEASVAVPAPAVVPAGGTFRASGDISSIQMGSAGSGLRLFVTTDGTNPAFNTAGNPDWTHTSRMDSGFISWGTGGPWPAAFGAFTVKGQNLSVDGRRSPLASAVFRVVGNGGVIGATAASSTLTAVAFSPSGYSAEAASGSPATVTVRNADGSVRWSASVSGGAGVAIRGLVFSASDELWVCGNLQAPTSAGASFQFSSTAFTFPTHSAQAGFLAKFDTSGAYAALLYEDASDRTSSFEGLAFKNVSSGWLYVAADVNLTTAGAAGAPLLALDASGNNTGSLSEPTLKAAGWNALGIDVDTGLSSITTLANKYTGAGNDWFSSVAYDDHSDILVFGGRISGSGGTLSYDNTHQLTSPGTGNVSPLVVAATGTMVYLWANTALHAGGTGLDCRVESVAALGDSRTVVAGTLGNDANPWSWTGSVSMTGIGANNLFWVDLDASGNSTAYGLVSSPNPLVLGGLTEDRTQFSGAPVYTSLSMASGAAVTGSGAFATTILDGVNPPAANTPILVKLSSALTPLWGTTSGSGSAKAGPLAHGWTAASARLYAVLYPALGPVLDFGQGLTVPAAGGSLLLNLFD